MFAASGLCIGVSQKMFLRSRCSMEMWCLDDIGRNGWDWVGPPAWERACFNSAEWVEAPRLSKRSLSRLKHVVAFVVVSDDGQRRSHAYVYTTPRVH